MVTDGEDAKEENKKVEDGIGAGPASLQIGEEPAIGAGFDSIEGTRCWDIVCSLWYYILLLCYSASIKSVEGKKFRSKGQVGQI